MSLERRAGLRGKRAVVAGGGEGMGRGIVLALLEAGVEVVACDISAAALNETAGLAGSSGERLSTEMCDVCDAAAYDAFWSRVEARWERLDLLVNVAGGVRHGAFLDSSAEDWDRLYRWNFRYVVQGCQRAARRMSAGGSIVNLTTIEAHRAAPGFTVYAGLKAGVSNFARSLAVELAPRGIRVNCIAPDQTPTPGLGRCIDAASYSPPPAGADAAQVETLVAAQAANAIPLGRPGAVADIENSVLFLASDLSAYITGTSLHVDGGAWASSGWLNFPRLGFRNRLPLDQLQTEEA
jgi:NAD(P)-dependent dehydrogenase (short-subunit alcohol dehydrogenase family)